MRHRFERRSAYLRPVITMDVERPIAALASDKMNAGAACKASPALFAAVTEASHRFGAGSRRDRHPSFSSPTTQALRARTGPIGRDGQRRALAGSVATATVFPVMSKNSTK